MEFDFDLEMAQVELECINDLLGIFNEFYGEECPAEDTDKMLSVRAVIFCARTHHYASLINAAQDKLIRLREQMNSAIESYYASKKGGAA